MKLDLFDVLWFLSWSALLAIIGLDATDIWFLTFGWFAVHWFGPMLMDKWADHIANKMRNEVHADV